jgi:hypothetical protein
MLLQSSSPIALPGPPIWRAPSYGLGLMGDPQSAWGPLWGHSGSGPAYEAAAFHAEDIGGRSITVCAMCATQQQPGLAEELVSEVLNALRREWPAG